MLQSRLEMNGEIDYVMNNKKVK